MSDRLWKVLAALVLVETLVVRLVLINQPIVENYVGRQIPTAMVARNLDRGGSFFKPELDTAPFPNYFIVEPPVYEWVVVWVHRLTGLRLEPAGRAVSALGIVLAAWAIQVICEGMCRRELGLGAALAFSLLPVTIRYGRAFQPDALAVGLVLAGSACWLRGEARNSARWRVLGGLVLSLGLATKVIGVFALGALAWDWVERGRKAKLARSPSGCQGCESTGHGRPVAPGKTPRQSGGNRSGLVILALTLLPALAWYGYATTLMNSGSRASSDNVEVWRNVLIPRAWGRIRTYEVLWRYFVVRTFTPLALGLAVVGWWRGGIGRFWAGWVVGSMTMLLLLAAKLHHEYYWLWLSPGVAVGAGSLLVERLAGRAHPTRSDSLWMLRVPLVVLDQCSDSTGRGRPVALREKNRARIVAWGLLLGMSVWLTRSTWRTPAEWRGLEGAARRIEAQVPRDAGLIATEAVLYAADRKGYRLETEPESIRRALGEWGEAVPEQLATPERLVGWYHEHGARYLADVGDPDEGLRTGWVEAFREPPYRVLEDRPGLFLVTLPEDDDGDH